MATLTKNEIDELMVQLKEKTEEVKGIYNKLIDAGVVPLPDDFLDFVSGGQIHDTAGSLDKFTGPKMNNRP